MLAPKAPTHLFLLFSLFAHTHTAQPAPQAAKRSCSLYVSVCRVSDCLFSVCAVLAEWLQGCAAHIVFFLAAFGGRGMLLLRGVCVTNEHTDGETGCSRNCCCLCSPWSLHGYQQPLTTAAALSCDVCPACVLRGEFLVVPLWPSTLIVVLLDPCRPVTCSMLRQTSAVHTKATTSSVASGPAPVIVPHVNAMLRLQCSLCRHICTGWVLWLPLCSQSSHLARPCLGRPSQPPCFCCPHPPVEDSSSLPSCEDCPYTQVCMAGRIVLPMPMALQPVIPP
jgi:hypothetical protein